MKYLLNKKNDMKKFNKIMIFLLLSSFALTGCSDLLDVDSNREVFVDEYQLKSANDTLYSMFAIFSQLEKIADSYVLLGELRGDLMTVTDKSGLYLKEINNFNISANNPYANNIKDYYSVINNCNYVIHNIDTSIVKNGNKVMYKEYAACKAIRAWTYMQIALNYGSAIYYDKPILTVIDAENIQKEQAKTITELATILIEDIKPWKDIDEPSLGSIYTHYNSDSFFPIRFILGDLYLWLGQYENAANEYHDLMFKNEYIMRSDLKSSREVINKAFTGNFSVNWLYSFNSNFPEVITSIAATNEYGQQFDLDSLTLNRMIAPSEVAINNWDKQMYYHSNSLDTLGDLRKYGSVSVSTDQLFDINTVPTTNYYIYKFILMNPVSDTKHTDKEIMPYRITLLYLRYAEAVNRLGKPNLALTVLKNGLNTNSLINRKIIPQNELSDPLPNYMNFSDILFSGNIGVRMHGCGNVNTDTTYYVIPKLDAIQDSVLYVEDLIQQELALETAFEGNRFHDLMRIAIRRDDPSYLANIVSEKHTDNKQVIKAKLLDPINWYIKK